MGAAFGFAAGWCNRARSQLPPGHICPDAKSAQQGVHLALEIQISRRRTGPSLRNPQRTTGLDVQFLRCTIRRKVLEQTAFRKPFPLFSLNHRGEDYAAISPAFVSKNLSGCRIGYT